MITIIKCKFCDRIGKDPIVICDPKSDCWICRGVGMIVVNNPLENNIYTNDIINGIEVAFYLN
jgi:hypothetical protein